MSFGPSAFTKNNQNLQENVCQRFEGRLACLKMHPCPGTGISNRVPFLFTTIYYSTVSVLTVDCPNSFLPFFLNQEFQVLSILTGGLQSLNTSQILLIQFQTSLG